MSGQDGSVTSTIGFLDGRKVRVRNGVYEPMNFAN